MTPLRLWPGVTLAVLLLAVQLLAPALVPDGGLVAVLGAIAVGLAILLWWLFFSRAPWVDRLGAIALMAIGLLAAYPVVDESIATGAMGMLLPVAGVPILSLALVIGAV